LGLHRSGLYYTASSESEENMTIMRLLDEQYYKTPFYGSRKLIAWLKKQDFKINRKRTQRLMDVIGWQTFTGTDIPVNPTGNTNGIPTC